MREHTKTFIFKTSEPRFPATVEIRLKQEKCGPVFSASGSIKIPYYNEYGKLRTKSEYGGQCLDEIKKHVNDPEFDEIYRLWTRYHMNDLHTGTEAQEQVLEDAIKCGKLDNCNAENYTKICEYLKSINLYEVQHEGKPYKYGHGWLYRPIPDEDLTFYSKKSPTSTSGG